MNIGFALFQAWVMIIIAASLISMVHAAIRFVKEKADGKYRKAGTAYYRGTTGGARGGSGGAGTPGGAGGPGFTFYGSGRGGAGGASRGGIAVIHRVGAPWAVTYLKTEAIVPGEIIAWRMWRVRPTEDGEVELFSLVTDYSWPLDAPAACRDGDTLSDGYGVHGYKDLDHMMTDTGWLFTLLCDGLDSGGDIRPATMGVAYGEVAMWGDVIEHQAGYRSQYARPRSISAPFDRELEAELRKLYKAGAPTKLWADIELEE